MGSCLQEQSIGLKKRMTIDMTREVVGLDYDRMLNAYRTTIGNGNIWYSRQE